MKIYDTYSKRKRQKAKFGAPDVYEYNSIPEKVLTQIQMILSDAIGRFSNSRYEGNANHLWEFIMEALAREWGDPTFSSDDAKSTCLNRLMRSSDLESKLDIVEFSFKMIDRILRDVVDYERKAMGVTLDPDDAINELNYRLRVCPESSHGIA